MLCNQNNIRLFLTDYPCLVNNMDTPKRSKNLYRQFETHTKLANYQAFSKERIENFYCNISDYFEILDGKSSFKNIKGIKRLDYFNDEIHLSHKGVKLY